MPGPGSNSKAKAKVQMRDTRRSRSRNTTPVSASSVSVVVEPKVERSVERSISPYLQTSLSHPLSLSTTLSNSPVDDIFDGHVSGSTIPAAGTLRTIGENIKSQLLNVIRQRDETCDRLIRELAQRKKERIERDRQRELAKRDAEERRQQMKKVTPKKREREEEKPLAVGAHSLSRQDGLDTHKGNDTSSPISSVASQPPPSVADVASGTAANAAAAATAAAAAAAAASGDGDGDGDADNASSRDSSSSPRQPTPAPAVQQYQVFGEDPSKFPDATVYGIRDVTPDTTEDEKKAIYCVAHYPYSDLHDLTPGTPPDRDFSIAKPTNQVSASTFANFVEPYLRPLTEEDRAFLLERGDRVHIFEIPKRGARHYKEIWAEEDGSMYLDSDTTRLPTNEPRGGIEQMNDDVAESDEVSAGPAAARLLTLIRPETRLKEDENPTVNGVNDSMEIDGEPPPLPQAATESKAPEPNPPATAMPESTWKNVPAPPRQDYTSMDDRILQELRHIGFLSPSDTPNYADIADDEVTARLRYLQRELRQVSLMNGARKARILELTSDRMAVQEWQTISDDLDNQLNQAYLKRNRNIGKGKKQIKRPGGPGGGSHVVGVARPGGAGVGEPIRSLMERKSQWNELIGPVVEFGKVSIPKETIFDKSKMDRLIAKEQDNWIDDTDDV